MKYWKSLPEQPSSALKIVKGWNDWLLPRCTLKPSKTLSPFVMASVPPWSVFPAISMLHGTNEYMVAYSIGSL